MMKVLPIFIFLVLHSITSIESSEAKSRCFKKAPNATRMLGKMNRFPYAAPNAKPQVLKPTESLQSEEASAPDDYSQRSVSPWRRRVNREEGRVPVEISVAECLYEGCIFNGENNNAYNSVVVERTMDVLKRVTCPHNDTMYAFERFSVSVPIACICVSPMSTSL